MFYFQSRSQNHSQSMATGGSGGGAEKGQQEKMNDMFKQVNKKMNKLWVDVAKKKNDTVIDSLDPIMGCLKVEEELVNQMSGGMSRQQKKYFEEEMAEEKAVAKEVKLQTEMMIMMKNMMGGREEKRYSDGDQSKVVGREAKKLENLWVRGLDFSPLNPFSKWMKVIFAGDYAAMMGILSSMSEAQVNSHKLLQVKKCDQIG